MSFQKIFNYDKNNLLSDAVKSLPPELDKHIHHVYGLRKIVPDYEGPAMRIHRTGKLPILHGDVMNDAHSATVFFDEDGVVSLDSRVTGLNIDTTLEDFVRTGGVNEHAVVREWFDQKGNKDAESFTGYSNRKDSSAFTNTGNVTHPCIVSGGNVVKQDNKPTVYFNNSTLQFDRDSVTPYENNVPSGIYSYNGFDTFSLVTFHESDLSKQGVVNIKQNFGPSSSSSQRKVNSFLGGHLYAFEDDIQVGTIQGTGCMFYENVSGDSNGNGMILTGKELELDKAYVFTSFVEKRNRLQYGSAFVHQASISINENIHMLQGSDTLSGIFGGIVKLQNGAFGWNGTGGATGQRMMFMGNPGGFGTVDGFRGNISEVLISTGIIVDPEPTNFPQSYPTLRDTRDALGIRAGFTTYLNNYYQVVEEPLNKKHFDYVPERSFKLGGVDIFEPDIGSSITFTTKNSNWYGGDYINNLRPLGTNNIQADINLIYRGHEDEIKEALRSIQKITANQQTGQDAFDGVNDVLNFGELKNNSIFKFATGFYNNFSGSSIKDYSLTPLNSRDIYQLNVNLVNTRNSSFLEDGMAFVNKEPNLLLDKSLTSFVPRNVDSVINRFGTDGLGFLQSGLSFGFSEAGLVGFEGVIENGFVGKFSLPATGEIVPQKFDVISGGGSGTLNGSSYSNFFYCSESPALHKISPASPDDSSSESILSPDSKDTVFIERTFAGTKLFTGSEFVIRIRDEAGTDFVHRAGRGGYFDTPEFPEHFTTGVIFMTGNDTFGQVFTAITGFGGDKGHVINGLYIPSGSQGQPRYSNQPIYHKVDSAATGESSSLVGNDIKTGIVQSLTQTFFFKPDAGPVLSVDNSNRLNNFRRSFSDMPNIGTNQNSLQSLELTFSNRGRSEAYAILHFLENHMGFRPFHYYYNDDIIDVNRQFYCDRWSHTIGYSDTSTIKATFHEVVQPKGLF